jgi:hypothetical protein
VTLIEDRLEQAAVGQPQEMCGGAIIVVVVGNGRGQANLVLLEHVKQVVSENHHFLGIPTNAARVACKMAVCDLVAAA